MAQEDREVLLNDVAEILFADLQQRSNAGGDMENDAFRYEMFARRIVAAQYGRPDALQWAREWHAQLVAENDARRRAQEEQVKRVQAERESAWQRVREGYASNPRYQCYLDTLENPETLQNNVGYFGFITDLSAAFARWRSKKQFDRHCAYFQVMFDAFMLGYTEVRLSERVRKARSQGGV